MGVERYILETDYDSNISKSAHMEKMKEEAEVQGLNLRFTAHKVEGGKFKVYAEDFDSELDDELSVGSGSSADDIIDDVDALDGDDDFDDGPDSLEDKVEELTDKVENLIDKVEDVLDEDSGTFDDPDLDDVVDGEGFDDDSVDDDDQFFSKVITASAGKKRMSKDEVVKQAYSHIRSTKSLKGFRVAAAAYDKDRNEYLVKLVRPKTAEVEKPRLKGGPRKKASGNRSRRPLDRKVSEVPPLKTRVDQMIEERDQGNFDVDQDLDLEYARNAVYDALSTLRGYYDHERASAEDRSNVANAISLLKRALPFITLGDDR